MLTVDPAYTLALSIANEKYKCQVLHFKIIMPAPKKANMKGTGRKGGKGATTLMERLSKQRI